VSDPGELSRALAARLAAVECPAFTMRQEERGAPEPIVLSHGRGWELFDADGRRYVDLAAGFGAVLLGHGHASDAIAAQSARLTQGLGDVYPSSVKVQLVEELAALHPAPRAQVLLAQSGSDAVTAAIKTATLATGRRRIIAFDGAYHGLGYAPLAACGFAEAFRAPFQDQLSAHVRFAPYPGLRGSSAGAALQMVSELLAEGDVALVLVEPVLGRGGIVMPPAGFLRSLSELAHRAGALVAADEIWTGLGRAGAWLRSVADGAEVDIVCLGKGLGGGLPLSACVASAEVMAGWKRAPGTVHTSTHAGAPLACAAALATLRALNEGDWVRRAADLGERALAVYAGALAGSERVRAVRGIGMMIGIELADGATAQQAIAGALARGYLVIAGSVDGATLTLTPPLTIDDAALLEFGGALRAVLDELD
jgi:4-aminobutyrate aminotransferase/(S)-3-amino-2-methylpropionate transaminase